MKTIEKECENCNKPFLADKREINRGNARFCSLSCALKHRSPNGHLPLNQTNICKQCGRQFNSAHKSKYCSDSCKLKNYRAKQKSGNSHDRALTEALQEYSCEICNWNETKRDVHHIFTCF